MGEGTTPGDKRAVGRRLTQILFTYGVFGACFFAAAGTFTALRMLFFLAVTLVSLGASIAGLVCVVLGMGAPHQHCDGGDARRADGARGPDADRRARRLPGVCGDNAIPPAARCVVSGRGRQCRSIAAGHVPACCY